ncbi:winged helix-turn-helix transcriptional regulator [Leifsonia sp. EB34]|uniref:winged helix-turn-helix transcriptional regulator n=1 Tax=Leifsonia sp. EB34 TaxID=3156303 RepID=UPI00351796F5
MTDDSALAGCAARRLLETIGSKWAILIILSLADTELRHSELRRRVGASQKMLTSTLKVLERDGLVRRTLTPSVPPRTDYALTERGASLLPVLQSIKEWANAHPATVSS